MPVHPFQHSGVINQLLMLFILCFDFLQVLHLIDGLFQLDIQGIGHQLGDPVHFTVTHPQHPADIPEYGFRLHGPEGDNLGNTVLPVTIPDVIDDFIPPVIAEIDVDIGHGDAFRIQEALEQ